MSKERQNARHFSPPGSCQAGWTYRPHHSVLARGRAASARPGWVIGANEESRSISVADLISGKVITTDVPIAPHNVQMSADGRLLMAVGTAAMGAMTDDHGETPGRLLVFAFDALLRGERPLVDLAVGMHPAHVVADAQGKTAFVSISEDNAIAIIDLPTGQVVARVATGHFPHGLRQSPDGKELLVANVADGSVSLIAVTERRELARIAVGKAPVQVAYTPGAKRAYVSLRDDNAIAVLDLDQRRKLAQIPVGRGPIQVFATPDGLEVYVANQGSAEDPGNTVSIIDTKAGRVVDRIVTGMEAHGVAISEDGSRAVVSNILDNSVSVIDTAARKVIATLSVGGPNGVTIRSATS